ncbi:MAG: GTPase (G3E family) [Lachnospiraceae bacterium]|nr:GTPase (G3E family) [Lachnospiraceae bacterium]
MRKFMVVSGFLGSGKTTTMMALTNHLNQTGKKAAMISNDLGRKGLADYRYSRAAGVVSEEISGECICFVTEDLVERLRRLCRDDGCEMIMSDIPGFGVGALEHVYCRLREQYPDECELAPFTVITEGAALRKLMNKGNPTLPDEMRYLLRSQLLEGDLIVLNKADLYTAEERAEYEMFLRNLCPSVPVMTVSALTGEGIPGLADYLCSHETAFPERDFGVTEEQFEAAFGKLSMYNCQYYAEVCCDDLDANAYLTELAEEIRDRLAEKGYDIPHLKLFAQSENGDYCKADLLGVKEEVILTRKMKHRCVDLPVVLNTTSAADPVYLAKTIDESIRDVSGRYNLSVVVFYKECFGLNDEGRI